MVKCQQLAILIALTALSLPAYGDKAKDAYSKGVREERKSDLDAAFADYKQAYSLAPTNARYFSAYTRVRFNAATQHAHTGEMLRRTGALKEALKEFQRAAEIDNTSAIAQQEVDRTNEMIRQQERLQAAPKNEPPQLKLSDNVVQSVELKPLSTAAISLKLNANADVVYQSICKLAGLNVIFDPDYKAQKISLDLTNVTLRDALDLLRLESKTFWRPVLPNTIVVAADSSSKRKELEQNVMKTFYLRNVSTAAELQEAATAVKQMLDVTHVQLLPAQDALILRATPDQMLLAEKLLADLDKPRSEVVIDITVMQISRNRLRNIGTNVPTSVSVGVTPPGGSGGSGTSAAASAASTAFKVGSFSFSVPGASFTLLASDSNSKILQSPQVRALNDEKASLRIGDRIPIATGSFSPTAGGASSIVSTQFTYLDVGVNIDITPHIHADGQVTLKMMLEISSVTGSETIGGITQPTIGQRRIEHETRLTDGEVNLLGGILEDSETKSLSGYPWLAKLPVLKYLFAQENKERTESEIVFAITPHIVRGREVTEENLRTIEVGTGNSIELHRKPAALPPADPDHPASPAKLQHSSPASRPPSIPAPHPASAGPETPAAPASSSPIAQAPPTLQPGNGARLQLASWTTTQPATAPAPIVKAPATHAPAPAVVSPPPNLNLPAPNVSVMVVEIPAIKPGSANATQHAQVARGPVVAKPNARVPVLESHLTRDPNTASGPQR